MKIVGIYIQDSTTLEYNRVDLFDDEKISVTSSIQNINDISKTYTDYSNTYTVPATKQNNKIFKHWYDNSNDNPFSTLTKSNAYIEIDTIPFRKGKIQLESANVVDGQPQDYSITFIGILGNLKDTFAGKYLKDLTSTAYDFNYTAANVGALVISNPISDNIMFPLISSDRRWIYGSAIASTDDINNPNHPIRYNELFPAIRLRAVLNMIETEFGINFDGTTEEPSTFLSDARFTNAYLYLKNADEFQKLNLEELVLFDTVGTLTYSPTPPISGQINLFQVPPILNNKILTNSFIDSAGQINHFRWVTLYITPTVANIPITIRIYTNIGLDYTNNIITTTSEQIAINYARVSYQSENEQIYFTISSSSPLTFSTRVLLKSSYESGGNYYYVNQNITNSSSQTITGSTIIPVKNYMPEIKIEDFFSGLLKMFNLTCYSNDGINYTVEQLESYYNAGSDIDITKYVLQDKKALNRVKTYKRINFEYEKSESFVNVAFESNAGIPYGTLRYVNNPITEGEEYSVKLPFEDLNFSNLSGLLQVGYCLKTDNQAYIPKPIILYDYNPTALTTVPTFQWSNELTGNGTGYTTYKAFGQETLISGETYGLNFNQQQSTLTNEIVDNSLYLNYYSNYFSNIYNLKARLVKVSAILPTSILTTLKLNDSIIIRDAKYLINSYTTDLTTGLVQFELLTDERVRIDLQEVNTFIGGVSSTISTDSLLATKLGISVSAISKFSIDGSNISCRIEGNYNIPASAFANNTNITYFNDLDGLVNTINITAFYGCTALSYVEFPNVTNIISSSAGGISGTFQNCTTLTSFLAPNLTSITGGNSFLGCSNLVTFSAPNLVGSIPTQSFQNLSNLINFTSGNITKVESNAFLNCIKLESINLNYCTQIETSAFSGCSALNSIVGLNACTIINSYAFYNCVKLPTFTTNAITTIGEAAFYRCLLITEYNFPFLTTFSTSTGAGTRGTFQENTALINFLAPNLTSITGTGNGFSGCSNLVTFSAPNLAGVIGLYMWQNCSQLVNFTVGGVTSINDGCFNGCSLISSIYIPSLTVCGSTNLNNLVFNNIKSGITITVSSALQTNNSGSPDGDLQYAITTRGATITYI